MEWCSLALVLKAQCSTTLALPPSVLLLPLHGFKPTVHVQVVKKTM